MSALLTVIPDARQAILDALRARGGLANVQITRSHPGADRVQPRAIWLGAVENADQRARVIGNKRRTEEFTVEVVVSVEYPGNDLDATEAELWPLVKEVAAALREDHTLGGAVDVAQLVPLSFDHYPGTDKRVAEMEMGVACRALV